MSNLHHRIRAIRHASYVERCHTEMTLGAKQTLGHHQYNVAQMVRLITDNECSVNLIMAALDHDLPEHISGDVPGHTKARNPALSEVIEALEDRFYEEHDRFFKYHADLSHDEIIVLKMADALELCYFCVEQRMLGNKWVDTMYHAAMDGFQKLCGLQNEQWAVNAFEIEDYIQDMWRRAVK